MKEEKRKAERRQATDDVPYPFGDAAARRSLCACLPAFHHGSRQRDVGPKGSAPGQASCDLVSTGVTRGLLSQSSGSTPRTGRNAGEHDARTRPGAECMSPPASAAPAPPWLSTLGRRRPEVSGMETFRTEMGTLCQGFSDN